MSTERNILGLTTKDAHVLLCVSFTINFCFFWHVLAPGVCKVLSRYLSKQRGESFVKFYKESPGSFNRLCTSLLFYTALPVCGITLLYTTNVLHSPFFAFDNSLVILFSINLGFYAFRIAQVSYYHLDIPHYQALLIHHIVAVATYSVIIYFEQMTISGVIGLLIEGNLVFAEFERLFKILMVRKASKVWKINMVLRALSAVIGKGLVPFGLLTYVFMTSSQELFQMSYIPLAFFFLSLVFFSCVNLWFIKDILEKCWRYFKYLGKPLPVTIYSSSNRGVIGTVINHDGLLKLSQQFHGAEVNITCNDLWEVDASLYEYKQKNDEEIPIDEESPSVIKTTNIL